MGRGPAVVLYDANGVAMHVEDGVAIPANTRGLLAMGTDGGTARRVKVAADGAQPVTDNGGSLTVDNANIDAALSTLATEAKLEAVRVLLASLDGKDYATQATLAAILVDTGQIEALLTTIDADTSALVAVDYATQTTLASLLAAFGQGASPTADTLQARVQELVDLLTGATTNQIGKVAQGDKAIPAGAWPVVLADSSGNYATITLDAGVYRQEITGKVSVTGAVPPPSTTPVNIYADTPLTVGSHDTVFPVPDGETFHLQEIAAGNEDPTKGGVVEVIFDDGSEHLVARVYTNGETISIGYADLVEARDGTPLIGSAGTSDLIVRRAKYAGTNIAIDATCTGYY